MRDGRKEADRCGPAPSPTFYIGEGSGTGVEFRYLGRILSQDDHDLSACVRNIQRAKAKWAAVSKVLTREERLRSRSQGSTL
jgi:hypothetical protein